ncbi:MAG: long-chain acyl-CoA synthetase, partial [Acidimicrobiaceae bacterium]
MTAVLFNPVDRAVLLVKRDHTLGTILERLAKVNGKRRLVAEAGDGLSLTYAQASKRVNRWAGGIAKKVEPGQRIVIAGNNGYEMLLLCLAASRAGAIPVPVNAQMRPDEIRHVIDDSGASLVIRRASEVDGDEPLAKAVPAEQSDVA